MNVRAGDYHSLAVAVDGKVYGFGANNFKQLGLQDVSNVNTPVQLPCNDVLEVACGARHSLLLTADAQVLSCGQGGAGQLGRDSEITKTLGSVSNISNVNTLDLNIAAGELFSVVVVRRSNDDPEK